MQKHFLSCLVHGLQHINTAPPDGSDNFAARLFHSWHETEHLIPLDDIHTLNIVSNKMPQGALPYQCT